MGKERRCLSYETLYRGQKHQADVTNVGQKPNFHCHEIAEIGR